MQTQQGTPGGGQHRQCGSRSGARVPSPWVSRPASWVGPAGSPGELGAVALEGWGVSLRRGPPGLGGWLCPRGCQHFCPHALVKA